MRTTPNTEARDLLAAPSHAEPMLARPHPDHRVLRAVEKVRDLVSAVPEELVDRDTLQALLMAADDGRYAVADAERYHGLWMEAQDEARHYRSLAENPPIHLLGEQATEPPSRAVVIDCEGDAWQRDKGDNTPDGPGWYCAGGTTPYTWAELLNSFGPVRPVYTP